MASTIFVNVNLAIINPFVFVIGFAVSYKYQKIKFLLLAETASTYYPDFRYILARSQKLFFNEI